jgi:hypothetical protein
VKLNLKMIRFDDLKITSSSLRRVGGKFSGPCVGTWAEALNFLDFFASFLGQAKNEEPARLEGIAFLNSPSLS